MKYKKEDNLWFNFTSMTDVVFLLLTFFMISVSFTGEASRLKVRLPSSKYVEKPEAQRKKKIVIECIDEKNIAINSRKIDLAELDGAVKNLADGSGDQVVVIRSDKDSKYGLIIKILGIAKSYNLNRISMQAIEEKR